MSQEIFLPGLYYKTSAFGEKGDEIDAEISEPLLKGIGLPQDKLFLAEEGRFSIAEKDVYKGIMARKGLGSGGLSVIVEGFDNIRQIPVAIKIFTPEERGFKQQFITDFAREARLMIMLDHPAILPVHGISIISLKQQIYPAIILEKADYDLETAILKYRGDFNFIAQAVKTVADLLDFLHQRRIAYIDVCPENILCLDNKVYLADFGSAVDRWKESIILSHNIVAAPELYKRTTTNSSYSNDLALVDQHALAVTAYLYLRGEDDYLKSNLWYDEAYKRGCQDHRWESQKLLTDKLPWPIIEVLAKATSFNPKDRYPTCSGFADALFQALMEI